VLIAKVSLIKREKKPCRATCMWLSCKEIFSVRYEEKK
jgi:hypothetical protein